MKIAFDHEQLFRQVTGREMGEEDAAEFRRLRAHMPSGLSDSPSYNFDLIVKYDQSLRLRRTISEASDFIADDVQRQSKTAVAKLVDDSVRRIHAASPSSSAAFHRGLWAAMGLMLLTSIFSTAAVYGAIAAGTIAPPWLSQQQAAKVRWADEAEARIGRDVDWMMRKGKPDASLMQVLHYLEARHGGSDPIDELVRLRACQIPGAITFHRKGKSYCRFEMSGQASQSGNSSGRR